MSSPILKELEQDCLSHMLENRIFFDGPLQLDGKIHRFSNNTNNKKKDEWYVAKSWIYQGKDYLSICYGSWINSDVKYHYKSWNNANFCYSHDEQKAAQRIFNEVDNIADQACLEFHEKAATEANRIWENSLEVPSNSQHDAYLRLKKVNAFNIRFGKNLHGYNSIIIPLRNATGKIRSLQFISINQKNDSICKSFLYRAEKKGCFFEIGSIKDEDTFCVSEGYATGASIYSETGCPVVVAFDCGNLEHVIAVLRTKYPKSKIVITGDDDVETENNPGRNKAQKVAEKYNCETIFPRFPNDFRLENGKKPTDFNDLFIMSGAEELKKQLLDILSKPIKGDISEKIAEGMINKQHPTERYSLSDLPLCISNYVSEMGQFSNLDPIMTTSALVGTISGFFKTTHLIPDTEYFQNLYPNLWILNILESGGFKSTALNLGNAIARKKQMQIIKSIKEKASSCENIKRKSEEPLEKWIDKEYAEILKDDVILPSLTTAPGLIQDISRGRGGTIFHHEFSTWLSNLEKTYNEGLKSLFTALYDVPDSFDQKTKGDGTIRIEKPFISICGVSTIDWIKEQIKITDVDSGFFARFLLFLPVSIKETPCALPRKKNRSALILAQEKIEEILNVAAGQHREYALPLETRKLFESVHEDMYTNSKNYSEKAQIVLDPYLKRWSPYILKLSMILQPFFEADKGPLQQSNFTIWPESISAALGIVDLAIKSTAFLFDTHIGESDMQKNCRKVLQYVAKYHGRISRHKLLSSKILSGGKKAYDSVLEMLEESGQLDKIPNSIKKDEVYFLIKSD